MNNQNIEILGAKEHNLKNIDLYIPKNKFTVLTGVSGSGKSSIAFDTLYAEGQRRYLETFSSYAKQFIGVMERPNVDSIKGLSPVISIEQKTVSKNPRSTVGTITEIYDFMRLLFARLSRAYSYNTGKEMVKMMEEEIIANITQKFDNKNISILASVIRGRKGHYKELFEEYRLKGYLKIRIDGTLKELVPEMKVDRYKIHNIELQIDKIVINEENKTRLNESLQTALKIGQGLIYILDEKKNIYQYSQHYTCTDTGISYEEPNPNTFSFNTALGACTLCHGIGVNLVVDIDKVIPNQHLSIREGAIAPIGKEREASIYKELETIAKKRKFNLHTPIYEINKEHIDYILYGDTETRKNTYTGLIALIEKQYFSSKDGWWKEWAEGYMSETKCTACNGTRLKKESLFFKIKDKNIADLSTLDISSLAEWFATIETIFNDKQKIIAIDILKEIRTRIQFLLDVGLHYLCLNLSAKTLSGGEAQRIRLSTQIGSQLQGITYILDEPSIGLHQRDNHQLINALKKLRDIGNTIIVVEHDKDIMLSADYLIDIGPGAGKNGGQIVAEGTVKDFLKTNTDTANYLNGNVHLKIPEKRREGNGKKISLQGVKGNNLKNITVDFPLGKLIVVTGVSGSGKSTLIKETLYPILYEYCNQTKRHNAGVETVTGLENIDKVIEIDQTPIGRTPRSNVATYCGFFSDIRTLFACLPESRLRAYKVGRFSFNVQGGRCEECKGAGVKTIEMGFLPDVYVHCSTCQGKRYNRETLDVRYSGKSIFDILELTVDEAVEFFKAIPNIYRKIKTLQNVGLGYISLGQSAVTFSGGEAQRIKLATELSRRETAKTIYMLDEPTTGLHFKDIHLLIDYLNQLVNKGNTVIIIEHNMDIIKMADYIIDMGPEGGKHGGQIIAQGSPEEIIKIQNNQTAKFLKLELEASK